MIIVTPSFPKATFSKYFPSARKRKAGVLKFLRFEECILKAPISCRISVDGRPNRRNKAAFSCRISVDGRPNRRNKAPFSNFSAVVWTPPLDSLKIRECEIHGRGVANGDVLGCP